jgi:Mn-containing catalase
VIGSIVAMLNKGAKGQLAEAALSEAELYLSPTRGGDSHTQAILYGGGPALTNSSGVPWTAAYVDSRGEPTVDLRSNIATESRAKIVYERLINITDDPGIEAPDPSHSILKRSARRPNLTHACSAQTS